MEIVYEILGVIEGIQVSNSTKDITDTKTMNFIIDKETNKVIGSIIQYMDPKEINNLSKDDVSFLIK